jgi:hypothetical protein
MQRADCLGEHAGVVAGLRETAALVESSLECVVPCTLLWSAQAFAAVQIEECGQTLQLALAVCSRKSL